MTPRRPSSTPKRARTKYDPATKAAAMAALLAGQGVTEVAAAYQIPEGTCKSWRARLHGTAQVASGVATKQRTDIGDLLLDYLRETLITLKAQAIIFRDPVWVKQQTAEAMAVLHGVQTDKTIRLLDALNGGEATIPATP